MRIMYFYFLLLFFSLFSPLNINACELERVGILDIIFEQDIEPPFSRLRRRSSSTIRDYIVLAPYEQKLRILQHINPQTLYSISRTYIDKNRDKGVIVRIDYNKKDEQGNRLIDYLYDLNKHYCISYLIVEGKVRVSVDFVERVLQNLRDRSTDRIDREDINLLKKIIEYQPKVMFCKSTTRFSSSPAVEILSFSQILQRDYLEILFQNLGLEEALSYTVNSAGDTLMHYAVRPPISVKSIFLEKLYNKNREVFTRKSLESLNSENQTPLDIISSLAFYDEDERKSDTFESYRYLKKIITPPPSPVTVIVESQDEPDVFDTWPTSSIGMDPGSDGDDEDDDEGEEESKVSVSASLHSVHRFLIPTKVRNSLRHR